MTTAVRNGKNGHSFGNRNVSRFDWNESGEGFCQLTQNFNDAVSSRAVLWATLLCQDTGSTRASTGIERTNERTNEFFINEGKGISTIFFFPSSPRAKTTTTTTTKTIKNKIIINSKTHINY